MTTVDRALQRDLPNAQIELVEGSHFLLETPGPYAIHRIRAFLAGKLS